MKTIWGAARAALAAGLGNLAGYAAFRAALAVATGLWRAGQGPPEAEASFGARLALVAFTAILFGAPPVLLGAGAARLAGRWRPWVGLAAGLWSLNLARWWPAQVPLLGPEAWVGPAALVLLSGLVGGWLIDQRAARQSSTP